MASHHNVRRNALIAKKNKAEGVVIGIVLTVVGGGGVFCFLKYVWPGF